MRHSMRWAGAILLLGMAAACAPSLGPTLSPDLPPTRRFPEPHPPDGLTVAREPEARWENKLRMSLNRVAPVMDWALFGLVVALQPYGSVGNGFRPHGFCPVGPFCP